MQATIVPERTPLFIHALLLGVSATLIALLGAGCGSDSCLSGEEDCVVSAPCQSLVFECSDESLLEARLVVSGDTAVPGGMDALAAIDDIVLSNGRVSAVIDALNHPHYLAP